MSSGVPSDVSSSSLSLSAPAASFSISESRNEESVVSEGSCQIFRDGLTYLISRGFPDEWTLPLEEGLDTI